MQNKTLIVLMAILAILAAIWGATTYVPKLIPVSSPYAEKIKSYDKNAVQSIVIRNSSSSLELKKENGGWKADGKKADTAKVNSLISELFPSAAPELIAQTNKRHKEFALTSDTATTIIFDHKLTWLLGKNTGTAVYARFNSDDNVYLLRSVVNSLSPQAADWYDKTILSFDQTKASKLIFKQTGKKTIALIKKEDKWVDEATSQEAKKDKVNDILAQASSLSAQSLPDPQKGQAYPISPVLTFTVEFDGKSETLELYKGNSDYLIKRLSDREQFIIGGYAVSPIISAPKELF